MMKPTQNTIQFRKGFVNLPAAGENNAEMAMTIAAELMQFGYMLAPEAITHLAQATRKHLVDFHQEILTFLKEMTGANRNYRPFWQGFPEQVMTMSERELWLHQIIYYCSYCTYEPTEWTKTRPTAFEHATYTRIEVGNEDRFLAIFTDLVAGNQSLTPEDLDTVKWFVANHFELRMPKVIPFKETLCTLAGMGLKVPVRTVTDVLRIAVHMSGGDIALPAVPAATIPMNRWSRAKSTNPYREAFKFKKFKRSERKYILGLLEQTNGDVREMALKDQRWIRLGEILHPGEYAAQFPKAFAMFDAIRNTKVMTWYGEVDAAFGISFANGLAKLAERPGEFVRRLDALIRNNHASENRNQVLNTLSHAALNSSNKVLYETYQHFDGRHQPVQNRTIMIKGKRKRTVLPDLPAISKEVITEIQKTIMSTLAIKFSALDSLGKVYLDEELKKMPLPTNMRTMNPALKPVMRGQRVPIGNKDAKVVRAFIHWFDETGREDIDLTGILLGMGKVDHIGWNGRHNADIGCYSGDVRYRQGACAEYVDINIQNALKAGYKYAIINACNFEGRSMASVKDCVFGYMEREHPEANMMFVPKTLANCVRLQSDASQTLAAIIDLEAMEYIFLDIDQDGVPVASANVDAILAAIKPYTEMPKLSVYDLLQMHVNARQGTLVAEADADLKLTVASFNTYVDILKWMGV